jgi:hypothetical protein
MGRDLNFPLPAVSFRVWWYSLIPALAALLGRCLLQSDTAQVRLSCQGARHEAGYFPLPEKTPALTVLR